MLQSNVHSINLNVSRESDKERLIIALIRDLARYDTAFKHIAIRSGETREQPSDPLRGIPHYFYHELKTCRGAIKPCADGALTPLWLISSQKAIGTEFLLNTYRRSI